MKMKIYRFSSPFDEKIKSTDILLFPSLARVDLTHQVIFFFFLSIYFIFQKKNDKTKQKGTIWALWKSKNNRVPSLLNQFDTYGRAASLV